MKRMIAIVIVLSLSSAAFAGIGLQASHVTDKQAGTVMISGGGTFRTDLDADRKASRLGLNTDVALFIFPVLAAGVDLGYVSLKREVGQDLDDLTETQETDLYLGPRVYFFFGGRHSELTPFIKGGANFLTNKYLIDGEEQDVEQSDLGLTASLGILLNLAKNVGISVEAEYNFEKGTAVEDIDTQQLLLKFGIRSFLGQ